MALPDNVGHLFRAALARTPDAAAVVHGASSITYAELDAACNRLGQALLALGVGPGDRVALMFGNHPRYFEALFGSMRIGAVPVPLNVRLGAETLTHILADTGAIVLIAAPACADRARALKAMCSSICVVIADGAPLDGTLSYESLVASMPATLPARRTDPDEVCMQPYTSGSTGLPKGVLLTHGGQIWSADAIRVAMGIDETERGLVAVPLYHKNAMIGIVKPFLLAGATVVVLDGFNAVDVISAIAAYRVTFLTGVPAMYRLLLAEHDALASHDVRSVRFAICGSATVPDDLVTAFEQAFGAPLVEAYGLTEGGPIPLTNTRTGTRKVGSCGRPIAGGAVRLVSEGGEVPVGAVGELVVRNPGVATGYWKRPDVVAARLRDGWLHTGDLMRQDSDGFFYYMGRSDDMINVAGENVYPKEVEDVLLRHPRVRDAAVVPAPHDVKGSVPVAFVVLDAIDAATEDELTQFFLARGAPFAHPRRIHFIDRLPLGSTGKLDRAALVARAAADQARG